MKDRVPSNPGRVLVTPENGSEAYYATITRSDNPIQEGTPINKNTLLESYEMEKEALIKKIKDYGEEKGFKLKSSKLGMVFVPLDENFEDEVSSEEFFKIKKELENMAIKVVYQIREIQKHCQIKKE